MKTEWLRKPTLDDNRMDDKYSKWLWWGSSFVLASKIAVLELPLLALLFIVVILLPPLLLQKDATYSANIFFSAIFFKRGLISRCHGLRLSCDICAFGPDTFICGKVCFLELGFVHFGPLSRGSLSLRVSHD